MFLNLTLLVECQNVMKLSDCIFIWSYTYWY